MDLPMNVTVIVPSLNPDEKLMLVVQGLLEEGFQDILLVNDGSSPEHLQPFLDAAQHPEVTVLTHPVNRGKGRAMKTAFTWCMEHRPGIAGVITVDGDNQHRPKDVRACVEAMERDPARIWLGVRDFSQDDVPLRSRFGNTVTRTVMRLACGVRVTDTQTGLRAIPAAYLPLMCRIQGERYEYETQMLISLRREKIGIGEVVIDTVYIDENQSSHFNTLRDSWKIYRIIFRYMFQTVASFLKYSASSVFCFVLDNFLFTLLNLHLLAGMANITRYYCATYGARVVSALVNFFLNRTLVFHNHDPLPHTAWRYFLLVVVQGGLSAGLVYFFTGLTGTNGFVDTLIKMGVDAFLFLISYQAQRRWVFRKRRR